jgi:hypothetical protein
MGYFFEINAVSAQSCKIHFFSALSEENLNKIEKTGEIPQLTSNMLRADNCYRTFEEKYSPKQVFIDFIVWKTDEKFSAATQPEIFEKYISDKKAERISTGELTLTNNNKSSKNKKVKLKNTIILCVIIGVIMLGAGLGIGFIFDDDTVAPVYAPQSTTQNYDGMIVANADTIDPNAEQITITIDRSYSAVPKEDLQLKGEIIDGIATIELPYFDPTDFFNHIPGYTYGFTSDPNGKKIEYHGGGIYQFSEDTKLYRVLVKYGGGSGVKEDPYLISYYDQLELLANEGGQGYFKQTANLIFPVGASHKPIDTKNYLLDKSQNPYFAGKTVEKLENPEDFYFEYDGGGFTIKGLTSPMFGTVAGMTLKNANITYSFIDTSEYHNFGFFVRQAYNYRYEIDEKIYETGETKIQNCTVSHSSITLRYPNVDKAGNPIVTEQTVPALDPVTGEMPKVTKSADYAIGAITGVGGDIENCYVTDFGIYSNLDKYIMFTGGISGKPTNVRNCGVFFVSMSGKIFNGGGIAGSGGGSRLYDAKGKELPLFYGGSIQGCYVRNFGATTEISAGGIIGVGSSNAENAVISNCYATELSLLAGEYADEQRKELLHLGYTGGIIAVDGTDDYGHYVTNSVSVSPYFVTGKKSKSTFSDTVMIAPANAFYLQSILNVINAGSIIPDNNENQELFTGDFIFQADINFDDTGSLPFQSQITNLIILVANIPEER